MSVRPETFVEEYATIRISEFTEKNSDSDFATVYVKFDAASTGAQGMRHNFGASAEAGGALAARLRQAYETGTPIYVAIQPTSARDPDGGSETEMGKEIANEHRQNGTYMVISGDHYAPAN